MKYAILLLIAFLLWHHFHHPGPKVTAPAVIKGTHITDENVWWDYHYKGDSRQIPQYVAECRPRQAHKIGTDIYSFWCSRLVNPIDKNDQLPASGWVWAY
jgi:hypothetical protein